MFKSLLKIALNAMFVCGNLKITFSDGSLAQFGDGQGEPVHLKFLTPASERAILINPGLGFPEGYMNGQIEFLQGDSWTLMEAFFKYNDLPSWAKRLYRFRHICATLFRRLNQQNYRSRAKRNVAHHYDLNADFYALFLDSDRQYSCAYFEHPDDDLETAQFAKKRHLASKLKLAEGLHVLDIGCGFGGMALYLADKFKVKVTGITLSSEQLAIARERAKSAKLDRLVSFELTDYRELDQRFDRIVSVGMFEHVGLGFYPQFFDRCHRLLTDDGVFVLHSIGRMDGPGYTHPFIGKYIFPGGYIPALSEVTPVIEKTGFHICDIEILRLHYAETLKAWRERFAANRDRAKAMYDEKFCRMWEFYLAGSESSFRHQVMMNFQIQLTKKRDVLPLTRTYMYEIENKLRMISTS